MLTSVGLAAVVGLGLLPGEAGAVAMWQHPLFANGMVLQQQMPVPVWGTADPGEQVTVRFEGQVHVTNADGSGRWQVVLDPLVAGGPFTLRIESSVAFELTDVRVGEVWMCGGQSNMVLGRPANADVEAYPDIRTFNLEEWGDRLPSRQCWEFGVLLSQEFGVPIGLLNNASGGTRIRTWLGPEVYTDPNPAVPGILAEYDEVGRLYDERVAVLQPYALRGVAWWQGESDRREPEYHLHMLPAMIRSWRLDWQRPDLPFIVVQLPTGKGVPFERSTRIRRLPRRVDYTHRTPLMRQAFLETTLTVPGVSMVITADLPGGLHPRMKHRPLYAERFFLAAMVDVYGQTISNYSGPIATGAVLEPGGQVRVSFREDTAEGLQGGDLGGPLQGVALLTEFDEWVWAEAAAEGNELVASVPGSTAPTMVRFAYGRSLRWASLYNDAGMMAAPFELPVEAPGP